MAPTINPPQDIDESFTVGQTRKRYVTSDDGLAVCQSPGLVEGLLDPFHRFDGGQIGVEIGFCFHGWNISDLPVQASMVVPIDVFSDGDFKIIDAGPRPLVADQLGLEK